METTNRHYEMLEKKIEHFEGDLSPFGKMGLKILLFAKNEGGTFWFGKPDRWYDKPRWRCENDHVSTYYIKSEENGDLCPACSKNVLLTNPEDKDGPFE